MMRIRRQSPQCLVTPCGPFPTPSSWPEHQSRDYNVTTTPDEGTRGMIHVGDMSAALEAARIGGRDLIREYGALDEK
jgi:hypothetical protein